MGANVRSLFSTTECRRKTELCSDGSCMGVMVVEGRDRSLLGPSLDICGIPGTKNEKREAQELNEVGTEGAEPTANLFLVIECLCDTKTVVRYVIIACLLA